MKIINGINVTDKIDMINRNTLYKNPGWFIKKSSKDYFTSDIRIAEMLEEIRIILDNIYGENWQFFFINCHTLPKIIILYPEIEISNEEGIKHTIRDLVLIIDLLEIDSKIKVSSSIKGLRLTVDKREYASSYSHSHLTRTKFNPCDDQYLNIPDAHYFCIGGNEVLETAVVFFDNQDLGTLELFFLTVNSMMKWESLEGGPYIRIKNLSEYVGSTTLVHFSVLNLRIMKEALLKNLDKLSYDMDLSKIKVVENDILLEIITSSLLESIPDALCFRQENLYYKLVESSYPAKKGIKAKFNFKGKDIPFKIYNNRKKKEEKRDRSNYQIHPEEYKFLIKEINEILYEKSIAHYYNSTSR